MSSLLPVLSPTSSLTTASDTSRSAFSVVSSSPPVSTVSSSSSTSTSTTPSTTPPSSTTSPSTTPTTSSSTSQSPSTESTSSSQTLPSLTTLTAASTSIWTSASVTTSNGQVYTTYIQVSTVVGPGAVITNGPSPPPQNNKSSSSTNVGAIVGGVVGGIGGLALLVLVLFFVLRRRRNNSDDFDGNFDPARLQHHGGGGGGTLPQVNLNDDQLLQEEDDGMGGRLAGSSVGGGIVTPFSYTPQQQQEMANAYPNPGPLLGAGYGAYGQQQQYANENPHALSPTHSAFPSSVSENSSYGASPYAPPIGRGPSPGPSVARTNTTNSSSVGVGGGVAAGGGTHYNNPRSAKEIEALGLRGVHVMNPSQDGEYSQHAQGYAAGVGEAAHQAYLARGPSSNNFAGRPGAVSPPGSVVVHRDGGRVSVIGQEEEHAVEAEIPPTYDSLPAEERM